MHVVSFLHNNKEKGTDSIVPKKEEICLRRDLMSRVSIEERTLDELGCCQQEDWQTEDERKHPLGTLFSPSRYIFQRYLHKTFVVLNCQDQSR